MPEIPEIETVRRHLAKHVLKKRITGIIINRPQTFNLSPEEVFQTLHNGVFTGAKRRGKVIALLLSNGWSIVFYFMLDGYVRFFYFPETPPDDAHVLIKFATGEHIGFFKMNLGYINLYNTHDLSAIPDTANLGAEPLSDDFSYEHFKSLLTGRKGAIKSFLMDQKFIAGIGNAYSNEILFCSRILPTRRISLITESEKARIHNCIKTVLSKALENGGIYEVPFASNDYLTGGFTAKLQVAYRTGEPCCICGHPIETKRVGGRNAFYCPVCQK